MERGMIIKQFALAVFFPMAVFSLFGQEKLSALEIIKKADDKMQGESNYSEMTMKIVRTTWERTISFKSWAKGRDLSLALITSPPREKGQSFLKRQNELWSWNPTINKIIKLPPSMLSQGWMGSDFSNDDLLKESSIVVDYTHEITGKDIIDGRECYVIELKPKEEAAVVWGKMIKWVSKKDFLQVKTEYYDEDGFLVKTELAYDIKEMGGRIIPVKFELIPADKEGEKTVLVLDKVEFDIPIEDSFFSQQKMKSIR